MKKKQGSSGDVSLHLTPPIFNDHMIPDGALPRPEQFGNTGIAAHACWFYYLIAHAALVEARKTIDEQIRLEGEEWATTDFVQQKRTVAMLYGLRSPEDMDRWWIQVAKECDRIGAPLPEKIYMFANPIDTKIGDT